MRSLLVRLVVVLFVTNITHSAICQSLAFPRAVTNQATPFVNSAFALTIDPERMRVAIGGYRGDVVVYETTSLAEITRLESDGGMVLATAFDPQGRFLLVAGDPTRLNVYRTLDWTLQRTIKLPFRCGFLCCHPKLPIVALSGKGTSLLFYNFETGTLVGSLDRGLERGFELMFTPDGQALLAVAKLPDNESTRRHLIATDTSGLSETGFRPADPAFRTLETTSVGFHSLVGSLSHSRFAVVDQSGRILVFDSQSLQLLTSIAGNFASGKGLAFVDRNTLGISTGDAFHTIDLSNPEASLTTPSDDAKNSNHLVYDFTQSRMFVSHARAKNQLTVWHLSSRTVDAGGFAGHPAGPIPGMEVAIDSSSMQPQESVAETEPIEVTSPVEKRIDQGTFHPADLAARLWTDTRSSKQIEANFIGIDGDEVLLRRSNADEIIVSRQRLAGADQKFLDEILETFPATTDFKSFAEDPIASGRCNAIGVQVQNGIASVDENDRDKPPKVDGASVLTINGSVPDRRGGFFLSTDRGLGKYAPDQRLVRLIAKHPNLNASRFPAFANLSAN